MKKRGKMIIRFVSLVLCVAGFVIPMQVFARILPNNETPPYTPEYKTVKGNEERTDSIIFEIKEERTECSKVFLLDDGSKMVAEYGCPIHYENDNGEWVDINNTLKVTNSISTPDEAVEEEYVNKSSNLEVRFSKKATKSNMIMLTSNDFSVSWGFDNVQDVVGKIVNYYADLKGNEKYTTLTNLTSETIYPNVYKNVDLQYKVTSQGKKENIILKDSDVQNEFYITYRIGDLNVKQTNEYCISLYDQKDKEVARISAPYLADAKGNLSTQLKLNIESHKDDYLNVKLTVSENFIHSSERAFPITIDPEITVNLYSKMYLTACTNNSVLYYPPYKLSSDSCIILTMSELPELAEGERIISAKLNLTSENASNLLANENDEPIIINAHKFESLSGSTITYGNDVLDYDSLSYSDNEGFILDITQQFKGWYHNGNDFDSIVLEAFSSIGSRVLYINGPSHLNQIRPSLTYTYRDFNGKENHLSYHTINAGHNGSASISDYLGNLVFTQNIYKGNGSRMPFAITLTYNSLNYNKTFENGSPSGKGWQFSFNQYIKETTGVLAEQGYN